LGIYCIFLQWVSGAHSLTLEFKTTVDAPSFVIEATDDAGTRRFSSVEELGTY